VSGELPAALFERPITEVDPEIAARIAGTPEFRERQERTLAGARAISSRLLRARDEGITVWSRGTDVHLVVADLRDSPLDGQQAEDRLSEIAITANRNTVPFDPRPPMVSSGVRLGTPALATRGLQTEDFAELGDITGTAFSPRFESERGALRERCATLAARYLLYAHHAAPTAIGRPA
jgi:glycine hydroxymethyltransferase